MEGGVVNPVKSTTILQNQCSFPLFLHTQVGKTVLARTVEPGQK